MGPAGPVKPTEEGIEGTPAGRTINPGAIVIPPIAVGDVVVKIGTTVGETLPSLFLGNLTAGAFELGAGDFFIC